MARRNGVTLLEVLLVVALIAVLIALIVPAVQRAREAAARAQSMNNLKQIILATHDYAQTNNNRLPGYGYRSTVFIPLLPYCGNDYSVFVSPADPTYVAPGDGDLIHPASYAANGQVFAGPDPLVAPERNIQTTFRDGLANTIAFAEHYSTCDGYQFDVGYAFSTGVRGMAVFADQGSVHPITSGDPPVSRSSAIGYLADELWDITFQAAPRVADCRWVVAQTPHVNGMLVAMADGSVRVLSPNVSPTTYWALITPAGGEQLGDDW